MWIGTQVKLFLTFKLKPLMIHEKEYVFKEGEQIRDSNILQNNMQCTFWSKAKQDMFFPNTQISAIS